MDYLNNGVLTKMEIKQCYRDHDMTLSDEEGEEIIASMFLRVKGVITFTEFAAATLGSKFLSSEEFLKPAFNLLDISNTGSINYSDIMETFERAGYYLDTKTLVDFVQEFDLFNDKKITYEEFKACMEAGYNKTSSK